MPKEDKKSSNSKPVVTTASERLPSQKTIYLVRGEPSKQIPTNVIKWKDQLDMYCQAQKSEATKNIVKTRRIDWFPTPNPREFGFNPDGTDIRPTVPAAIQPLNASATSGEEKSNDDASFLSFTNDHVLPGTTITQGGIISSFISMSNQRPRPNSSLMSRELREKEFLQARKDQNEKNDAAQESLLMIALEMQKTFSREARSHLETVMSKALYDYCIKTPDVVQLLYQIDANFLNDSIESPIMQEINVGAAFFTFKMKEDESLVEYGERFDSMVVASKSAGFEPREELMAAKFIHGLNSKWSGMKVDLHNTDNDNRRKGVKEKAYPVSVSSAFALAANRVEKTGVGSNSQETSVAFAANAKPVNNKNKNEKKFEKGKEKRGKEEGGKKESARVIKCSHCEEEGHYYNKCPHIQEMRNWFQQQKADTTVTKAVLATLGGKSNGKGNSAGTV